MIISLDKSGTVLGFKEKLEEVLMHDDVKSCLILSADENEFTSDRIDPILKQANKPVFGGIFPEIISSLKISLSCS